MNNKDKFENRLLEILNNSLLKTLNSISEGKSEIDYSISYTSESLKEFSNSLSIALEKRKKLLLNISDAKLNIENLQNELKKLNDTFLYKLFNKKENINIVQNDIEFNLNYLNKLKSEYEINHVKININDKLEEQYDLLLESFKYLITSNKIWDITSIIENDEHRSSAKNIVTRNEVKFKLIFFDFIFSKYPALYLENYDGESIAIYPNFILTISKKNELSIIDFKEISIQIGTKTFLETEIPADTAIINYQWEKVNRDGSPDLRYKDNYKTPIVEYGKIEITINNNKKETYYISNLIYTTEFGENLKNYFNIYDDKLENNGYRKAKEIEENKSINKSKTTTNNNKNNNLQESLDKLNSLIGLKGVKQEISSLINFIKIQKAREQSGLKSSSLSYHIVFTGNPGTGKTTVARLIAEIYKELNVIKKGQLVETDRSGLIAEYLGQTAIKVNKTVDSAIDGVLFIDEAYSLVGDNKDDFGKEAIATLVKRIEDDRDKLIVILAGYDDEMQRFIDVNPGLKSRFNNYIKFEDYSPDELLAIYKLSCLNSQYILTEEAEIKLYSLIKKAYENRDKSFGNGRFVRNLFENTLEHQANRLSKENNLDATKLSLITSEDIPEGI